MNLASIAKPNFCYGAEGQLEVGLSCPFQFDRYSERQSYELRLSFRPQDGGVSIVAGDHVLLEGNVPVHSLQVVSNVINEGETRHLRA